MRTWTVPGYTEVSDLGATGATRTALARHTATGARVAIRYLGDDDRRDETRLAAYREDARRLAALDSPHVVACYEYVESADGAATVREHVDGVTLAALVGRHRLRPEVALTVLKGVLRGLLAAQAGGVRHCRYAPENVLVDRSGHVKLLEGAGEVAADGLTADVGAAFATYLSCFGKKPAVSPEAAIERLPKRLRPLAALALAGDGLALLAELDAIAPGVYGTDWEAGAREQLARQVDRRRPPDRT